MKNNNQVYEAIRELILLTFFTRNNFDIHQISLGEYQYKGKLYQIHSYWDSDHTSIFIKCRDESIHLIVEDNELSRRYVGPVTNDVYLHINKYKNIDFCDVVLNSLYFFKNTNKENIDFESKIEIDYGRRSDCMYTNPNGWGIGPCGFKGKRFIFNRPETFDKKIKNEKCIELFKDEFSPEIILNLIEQIYPNFEQIHINNKIDRIINSLSQKELLTLKERLLTKEESQLVKKLTPIKNK